MSLAYRFENTLRIDDRKRPTTIDYVNAFHAIMEDDVNALRKVYDDCPEILSSFATSDMLTYFCWTDTNICFVLCENNRLVDERYLSFCYLGYQSDPVEVITLLDLVKRMRQRLMTDNMNGLPEPRQIYEHLRSSFTTPPAPPPSPSALSL